MCNILSWSDHFVKRYFSGLTIFFLSRDPKRKAINDNSPTGSHCVHFPAIFPLFAPASASGQTGRKLTLNVRDFGAVGDGKTKDTDVFQHVLDRCSVLGGCEVLVPPGDYLTGVVALRSNTTLRLERGARLRDLKVTGYTGPLLGIHNVTGSGLKGAAAIPAPQLPEPVPAPAQPYRLR